MFVAQEIVTIPDQIDEDALPTIGYRAMSRYKLARLGLPVPPAFVITAKAFYAFLNHDNGLNKWRSLLENVHAFSTEDMVTCSQSLQRFILHHSYPTSLTDSIFAAYTKVLGSHWAHLTISPTPTTKVPVNFPLPVIKGESALLDFLRQTWSAQVTPHAISLHLQHHPHELYAPSPIMVSQFEPATASGSIITIDPQTKDKNVVRIEAVWGTNPQTDPHTIAPDTYIVSKNNATILSRIITHQKEHVSIDRFGQYRLVPTKSEQQSKQKLTDDQMIAMTKSAIKVHDFMVQPQIINWLLVDKQIYFTRFRNSEADIYFKPLAIPQQKNDAIIIAAGLAASPGMVIAPIIRPTSTTTSLTGRIAVYKIADPLLISRSRQAAGIIIEAGGLTTEFALAAREIGIPTIVGVGPLSIHDGQTIVLDATSGQIRKNNTSPQPITSPITAAVQGKNTASLTTATKMYLNLNQIDPGMRNVYQQSDGVGICRGANIICQTGTHPKFTIKHHESDFTGMLSKVLLQLSENFGDRPIYYQPYDLDTLTAVKLHHGEVYESSIECNPLIGLRGSARLMHDNVVFQKELAAITVLRHRHNCNNISLIIPLLRSAAELVSIKQQIAAAGLYRSPSFKIMAEIGTSSAIDLIPQWAEIGIDGFILNLDMLAALTLGYDPNAAEVDQFVTANHPSVLRQVRGLVELTNHLHIPLIATSYQLDQSTDVLEAILKTGIHHIVVNPVRFISIKQEVQAIETKVIATNHTSV